MTLHAPHAKPELEIPLDDDDGDHLLDTADALAPLQDADDLPILTDVVDDFDDARVEPFIGESEPIILEPVDTDPVIAAVTPKALPTDLAERLVALDTAIARHIEDWVANELPQLVSRELDELAERLSTKAAAHLRATLLPLVSARIADSLDSDADA